MAETERRNGMKEIVEALNGMKTEFAVMGEKLETNTEATEELVKIVKGDNSEGLITKVALNRTSLARAWWWLGAISLLLLSVMGFVLRSGL